MKFSSVFLLFIGAFSMLLALLALNITLASQGYRGMLMFVLAAMVLADVCCGIVVLRGGRLRRVALFISIGSLFIVADVIRRAFYVFW